MTRTKLLAAGLMLAAGMGVSVWSAGGLSRADAQDPKPTEKKTEELREVRVRVLQAAADAEKQAADAAKKGAEAAKKAAEDHVRMVKMYADGAAQHAQTWAFAPAARAGWEYKVLERLAFANNPSGLNKELNALGKDGWELVSADGEALILKRSVGGRTAVFQEFPVRTEGRLALPSKPSGQGGPPATTERRVEVKMVPEGKVEVKMVPPAVGKPLVEKKPADARPTETKPVEKVVPMTAKTPGTTSLYAVPLTAAKAAETVTLKLDVSDLNEYAVLIGKLFPTVTAAGVKATGTLVLRGPAEDLKLAMELAKAMADRERAARP